MRNEQNLACPAGAQEGRHQGFHPLVNHPFPIITRRKSERRDRCEKENGSRVTIACLSQIIRSSQIAYCYTCGLFFTGATQGELPEGQEKVPWGIPVSRNSLTWWLQTTPANYTCRPTPASSLLTYGISSPFAKLSIYVSRHPGCAFVHFV